MSTDPNQPRAPSSLLSILGSADSLVTDESFDELRQQLVRFLEWQQCPEPEEAAQAVLTCGLTGIAGGEDLSKAGVRRYFFETARNLMRHGWTSRTVPFSNLADGESKASSSEPEQDGPVWSLDQRLSRLSVAERRLIVRYYTEDRVALCRELNVSAESLRIRVHRIRRKIEPLQSHR